VTRTLLALAAGLVPAAALADGLLPPPAGKKYAPVTHVVTAAKAWPDFEFYQVKGGYPTKVPFGPDDPVTIDSRRARGPRGGVQFVAVPKGAAAKYATPEEFGAALAAKSVPGQAAATNPFLPLTTIDAKDDRKAVTEKHEVERIDAKDGIVFRGEKAPTPNPGPPAPPKFAPGDDEPVDFCGNSPGHTAAYLPRGGAVVSGLAAALAAALGGLWLVRRAR
jgi:hypothetical protein